MHLKNKLSVSYIFTRLALFCRVDLDLKTNSLQFGAAISVSINLRRHDFPNKLQTRVEPTFNNVHQSTNLRSPGIYVENAIIKKNSPLVLRQPTNPISLVV
jgi:hypothetical protein